MIALTKKQEGLLVCLLAGLAFLLRFFSLSEALWSGDAVDFALGLSAYDLSKYQPHSPGYPLYMLFSKLLSIVLNDEVLGLQGVSLLFGALTVLPFFYLVKQMHGRQAALLSAILLAINPLHWLMSTRALSDITGLFFVVLCVLFLYRATDTQEDAGKKLQNLLRASFFLGIALGVRLSYFPHLFLWGFVIFTCRSQLKAGRNRIRILIFPLLTFIATVLLWGIAQALFVGTESFFSEILNFGRGHFINWGGTILTQPDLLSRFKELVWQDIILHGLGGGAQGLRLWVVLLSLTSLLLYVYKEGLCFRSRFLCWWVLPYLLWVLMGQNLNNPRHILAALPVLMLVIARGGLYVPELLRRGHSSALIARKYNWLCPAILIIALCSISLQLAADNRQAHSAMHQLVFYVKIRYDPAKTIVFCRETRRLFDYYAPQFITVSEETADIEAAVAFHAYGQPDVILVTSDLLDQWRVSDEEGLSKLKFNLVSHFQHDPYLQNANHQLVLYRLEV